MEGDYRIGRYNFNSEKEYLEAKREFNTIKILTEKYNLKDPKVARIILSKFIPATIFGEKFVAVLRSNCETETDDELLESLDTEIKERTSKKNFDAEIVAMKCPNCGSALEISSGIGEYKCEYCGHRIVLNNETRIKADIKLKELEHDERKLDKSIEFEKYKMQKEEEEKEKAVKKKKKIWKTVLIVWVGLILFGIIGTAIDYKIHPEDYENLITVRTSAKKMEGQNYQIIVAELQDAGFTNIEAVGMEDLKQSLFTNTQKLNGTIDRISINGISDFTSDTSFPSDAIIRISYHSFPQQTGQTAAVGNNNDLSPPGATTDEDTAFSANAAATKPGENTDSVPVTDYTADSNTQVSDSTESVVSASQSDDDNWATLTGADGKIYRYYKKDPDMIVENHYPIIGFLEITDYCDYTFPSDVTVRYNPGIKEYDLEPTYDVIFSYQMENLCNENIIAEIWFRPTLTVNGVDYELNDMGIDKTCGQCQRVVLAPGQKSDVLRVCFSGYGNNDCEPIPIIKEGSSLLLNMSLNVKKNSEADWVKAPATIDLLTGDFPDWFY